MGQLSHASRIAIAVHLVRIGRHDAIVANVAPHAVVGIELGGVGNGGTVVGGINEAIVVGIHEDHARSGPFNRSNQQGLGLRLASVEQWFVEVISPIGEVNRPEVYRASGAKRPCGTRYDVVLLNERRCTGSNASPIVVVIHAGETRDRLGDRMTSDRVNGSVREILRPFDHWEHCF